MYGMFSASFEAGWLNLGKGPRLDLIVSFFFLFNFVSDYNRLIMFFKICLFMPISITLILFGRCYCISSQRVPRTSIQEDDIAPQGACCGSLTLTFNDIENQQVDILVCVTSIVSNKRITIWKEDMHICISGDKEKDKKKQNGEEAWPGYISGASTSLKTIMANNWHINLFFINYDGEPKTITRHVK